jgi:HD superfamily phosphohydrolase YqeK
VVLGVAGSAQRQQNRRFARVVHQRAGDVLAAWTFSIDDKDLWNNRNEAGQ